VGNLTRPKGIAVDSSDNLYVVESYFDHLLVFGESGRFLLPIGGHGSAAGQFFLPAGAWSDARGRIFVADMFNGRVSIFLRLGEDV
jgi:DNA-binding beta-propeller fold protein YncE